MNEELQSTNEELHTVNAEMRQRSAELDHTNGTMAAILASLRGGVAVVDPEMQVEVWSRKSEDLWGLRAEEVLGKHFLNLDIGLPVDQLRPPIRACLAGEASEGAGRLDATNRRGKAIQCKVTCTPLHGPDHQPLRRHPLDGGAGGVSRAGGVPNAGMAPKRTLS